MKALLHFIIILAALVILGMTVFFFIPILWILGAGVIAYFVAKKSATTDKDKN